MKINDAGQGKVGELLLGRSNAGCNDGLTSITSNISGRGARSKRKKKLKKTEKLQREC